MKIACDDKLKKSGIGFVSKELVKRIREAVPLFEILYHFRKKRYGEQNAKTERAFANLQKCRTKLGM